MEDEDIITLYWERNEQAIAETITRRSNDKLPDGRNLPNAFVISGR